MKFSPLYWVTIVEDNYGLVTGDLVLVDHLKGALCFVAPNAAAQMSSRLTINVSEISCKLWFHFKNMYHELAGHFRPELLGAVIPGVNLFCKEMANIPGLFKYWRVFWVKKCWNVWALVGSNERCTSWYLTLPFTWEDCQRVQNCNS